MEYLEFNLHITKKTHSTIKRKNTIDYFKGNDTYISRDLIKDYAYTENDVISKRGNKGVIIFVQARMNEIH